MWCFAIGTSAARVLVANAYERCVCLPYINQRSVLERNTGITRFHHEGARIYLHFFRNKKGETSGIAAFERNRRGLTKAGKSRDHAGVEADAERSSAGGSKFEEFGEARTAVEQQTLIGISPDWFIIQEYDGIRILEE